MTQSCPTGSYSNPLAQRFQTVLPNSLAPLLFAHLQQLNLPPKCVCLISNTAWSTVSKYCRIPNTSVVSIVFFFLSWHSVSFDLLNNSLPYFSVHDLTPITSHFSQIHSDITIPILNLVNQSSLLQMVSTVIRFAILPLSILTKYPTQLILCALI